MSRIFSNGGPGDFVIKPFDDLIHRSSHLYFAAPYFTRPGSIIAAAKSGKTVQLLVGLNSTTSPDALSKILEVPSISVRYLTHRFHAKIYIFDNCVLLGSSNLTDGGLMLNREAVICLDRPEDADAVEEVRALFLELWDAGQVVTREKLASFSRTHRSLRKKMPNADAEIEKAVGRAEPPNVHERSRQRSTERIFLEGLRRQVYEQYRPAFNEVAAILLEHRLQRDDLVDLGVAHETNRFLNFVRLTHVVGDDAWRNAPFRDEEERRGKILRFGQEWVDTSDTKIAEDYVDWLMIVNRVFGSPTSLEGATREEVTSGLESLHAFAEQLRFVKGGKTNLASEFWNQNNENLTQVKSTLLHLLYGSGDFIQRLHDIIYNPKMKLRLFGHFCALELYGTIHPQECPPMNGRIAKALRFVGFDVKAT